MGMLERMMRQEMYRRRQMSRRGRGGYWAPQRHRQRGGFFGSPYGRRHRGGFFGSPYGRHRRQSRVRVFGCCLPFPIGALALSVLGARLLRR